MSEHRYDIVIAGGGMIGTSLALALAPLGLRVAIVEAVARRSIEIIPRGGKGLIERISATARVPVIKHLDGICHVYIDDEADYEKALQVADRKSVV